MYLVGGQHRDIHDLQNRYLYLNTFNMMSISNQESIQFTIVVRIEMLSL